MRTGYRLLSEFEPIYHNLEINGTRAGLASFEIDQNSSLLSNAISILLANGMIGLQ